MATSDGSSQSLFADLTCSLCLSIFDRPKIMPNCPHTFCLECLERLVKANKNPGSILCPECRVANQMPTKLTDLSTNLVVQNIAEKMRQQKEITDSSKSQATKCPHFLLGEKREMCPHCNEPFCDLCKYRHIANMEKEITRNSGKMSVMLSSLPQLSELEKQLDDRFQQDEKVIIKQADELKAKVNEMVSTKLAEVLNGRKSLKIQTLERVQLFIEQHKAAVKSADSIKDRQKSLNYDLKDVANTYAELTDAITSVETLTIISNSFKSSIINLKSGLVYDEILNKLSSSNNDLAALQIDQKVDKTLPDVSAIKPQLKSITAVKKGEKTLEKTTISLATGQRKTTKSAQSFSGIDFRNAHLSEAPGNFIFKRIVAFPAQGEFAVLLECRGSSIVSFFKPNGVVSEDVACALFLPPDARSMTVFDIATDYRQTIYFTAQVKYHDGTISKKIFRVWRNNNFRPDEFATSDIPSSFYGLAISEELGWVFTTAEGAVMAYESINNRRGEPGEIVARYYIGPRPNLIAVDDNFGDRSIRLFGKSEGEFQMVTVDYIDDPDPLYSYFIWPNNDENNNISNPEHVAYFYDGAVVCKGNTIYKVENARFPTVVGSFRADFLGLVDDAATVTSISVLKPERHADINDKIYIGVVYNSNKLVIAELAWK